MAATEFLSDMASRIYPILKDIQPLTGTYAHLVVSALLPIYAGARASLSRPTSAVEPAKKASSKTAEEGDETDDGDETDEEEDGDDKLGRMEGMSHADVIIFPLLAGCTLTALYMLIKWLGNADYLNIFLSWYFSFFSIFSVTQFLTDAGRMVVEFTLPRRYAHGDAVYQLDYHAREAVPVEGTGATTSSPLPGMLSHLPIPSAYLESLWAIHSAFNSKLAVRASFGGGQRHKMTVNPLAIAGFLAAVSSAFYMNLGSKPWWLTNLSGFSFSYGALQLMSPTSFTIGTMLLVMLFFYDIYMVFKTPMMVTVAKSLDIPIKLVFPRPPPAGAKDPNEVFHAMLGLGDIVIPGLLMCLALRFDHYLFYLRQQTVKPAGKGTDPDEVVKAKYHSPPKLAQSFWLLSWTRSRLSWQADGSSLVKSFPKPYFRASLVGYLVGIVATLFSMHAMKHAQPALLYLVPGVVISIWGTALVRGEVRDVWAYSEATEEKEDDCDKTKPDSLDVAASGKSTGVSMFALANMETNSTRLRSRIGSWFSVDAEPTESGKPAENDQTEASFKEGAPSQEQSGLTEAESDSLWELERRRVKEARKNQRIAEREEKKPKKGSDGSAFFTFSVSIIPPFRGRRTIRE